MNYLQNIFPSEFEIFQFLGWIKVLVVGQIPAFDLHHLSLGKLPVQLRSEPDNGGGSPIKLKLQMSSTHWFQKIFCLSFDKSNGCEESNLDQLKHMNFRKFKGSLNSGEFKKECELASISWLFIELYWLHL